MHRIFDKCVMKKKDEPMVGTTTEMWQAAGNPTRPLASRQEFIQGKVRGTCRNQIPELPLLPSLRIDPITFPSSTSADSS
jgi:hypothetical protein